MTIENGALITIRDAKLIRRNFEGRATKYKDAGPDNRAFTVVLDEKVARQFLDDGLNVKTKTFNKDQWEAYRKDGWNVRKEWAELTYGDPEDPAEHTLQVAVGYKIRPPRVTMITSKGRITLGEDTVGTIDWVDIELVDFVIRCGHWSTAGNSGVKAWLKTMFVTINEDELEAEYGINDVQVTTLESTRDEEAA